MTNVIQARERWESPEEVSNASTWGKPSFEDDARQCLFMLEDLLSLEGKVLDVGCGASRILRYVTGRPGATAIGIDLSWAMLTSSPERVVVAQADITHLPFGTCSFDNAYSILVFQHLSPNHRSQVLKEVHRVLKPGGHFAFQFVLGDDSGADFSYSWSASQMETDLQEAGFSLARTILGELNPEWGWAVGRW